MAITFPRTWPASPGPKIMGQFPRSVSGKNESPSTLVAERFRSAGRKLQLSLSYPAMTRAQGDPFAAILASLDGTFRAFRFGPHGDGANVKGQLGGTPRVNGANQLGNALLMKGGGGVVSGYLLAGDWIGLITGANYWLHLVMQDMSTDGSGNGTIDIFPDLLEAPEDNDVIVTSSPKGTFHLLQPIEMVVGPAYNYEPFSLEIEQEL